MHVEDEPSRNLVQLVGLQKKRETSSKRETLLDPLTSPRWEHAPISLQLWDRGQHKNMHVYQSGPDVAFLTWHSAPFDSRPTSKHHCHHVYSPHQPWYPLLCSKQLTEVEQSSQH